MTLVMGWRNYRFVAAAFLIAWSLAVVVAPAKPAQAADVAKSPNIVLIVSDDQAWTDYGFMGHPHLQTPRLDRLASESRVFTRGYVPSSLCCPSLASIITGLYPHQHKITGNDPVCPPDMPRGKFYQSAVFKEGREVMNRHLAAVATLPQLLSQHGYRTLQTGKWWQGHFSNGGFTDGMTQGGRHGDDGLDIGRKTMQPIYDFVADARKNKQPFFVWYAPLLPHDPHTPPERLLKKYQSQTDSIHVAKYWAMVEWFDETCGQLLDHLDSQGLANDTIVVYVTDNGWIQNPNGPKYAERSKQSPFDGGLRTPIMIRWPGKVAAVKESALASSLDLLPTLLTAVGIDLPPNLSGINLLDDAAVKARNTLYGECFTQDIRDLNNPDASLRYRWIISGNWKLIQPHPALEPNEPVRLFNILNDPLEEQNLAEQHPDTVAELQSKLDDWYRPK